MRQDPESSGDYGYDLVHEEIARGKVRDGRPGDEHGSPPPAGRRADAAEDMSYDEAHDF